MIAASCVATDMAGGRHPVAPMTRFHAEEDRRARGGIAPAQTSRIFLFGLSWRHVLPGAAP